MRHPSKIKKDKSATKFDPKKLDNAVREMLTDEDRTAESKLIFLAATGLKKPELKVRDVINNKNSALGYQFMETELQMPDHDFDIRLIRPDGTSLLVQWRVENETVDICLCKDKEEPDKRAVYVTKADLSSAKRRKDGSLKGEQITII